MALRVVGVTLSTLTFTLRTASSFQYSPMSTDALAARIIAQIEAAFDGVRLDGGVSLREAEVLDACGSVEAQRAARLLDETEDWRKIPDSDFGFYWDYAFFDAKGVVFHLPAYMRFALRICRPKDPASFFTITALGRHGDYIELLNDSQKEAVREFLRFMANLEDDFLRAEAKRALEEVWAIS